MQEDGGTVGRASGLEGQVRSGRAGGKKNNMGRASPELQVMMGMGPGSLSQSGRPSGIPPVQMQCSSHQGSYQSSTCRTSSTLQLLGHRHCRTTPGSWLFLEFASSLLQLPGLPLGDPVPKRCLARHTLRMQARTPDSGACGCQQRDA